MSNLPYVSDDAQISSSNLLARSLVLVGARRRGLRENEVVGGGLASWGGCLGCWGADLGGLGSWVG
ncbi:unnamed protein product [Prunus armeniaca]|uniref:Uncharacterized protein n=1 Tax=Prunus armeniaca TaxID=36596 RepID=A0A6J5WED6_PRUAR|nr:unnamed protein product [Prunus armeniaca]CAB4298741.1 unnamed protein product [Prunus armeniaca]